MRLIIENAINTLQEKRPLVHCMTNNVANLRVADILCAVGASPLMTNSIDEVDVIAAKADALTLNIGMVIAEQFKAMLKALDAAKQNNRPVVLDPVAHFASPFRSQCVKTILEQKPEIIRGNASEIMSLVGSAQGRGVDSGNSVESAVLAAEALAVKQNCVVAVSGQSDFITNGHQSCWVDGGHPLMERLSALGCALTGVVGAFSAIAPAFEATIAAHSLFAVAGKRASEKAKGPASFYEAFFDYLYTLSAKEVALEVGLRQK